MARRGYDGSPEDFWGALRGVWLGPAGFFRNLDPEGGLIRPAIFVSLVLYLNLLLEAALQALWLGEFNYALIYAPFLGLVVALVLAPLLVAAGAAAVLAGGPVRRVALLGAAWLAEVALMAQLAGTSGEPRYALPGAALLAVAGAAALARLPHPALVRAAAALVAVAAVVRLDAAGAELERAGDEAELYAALPEAVARAGGARAVLACGAPVTGRYRGPAVAYALGVPKRAVRFDPAEGGVLLRSRIRRAAPVRPAAPPGARVIARSVRWELAAVPGGRRAAEDDAGPAAC